MMLLLVLLLVLVAGLVAGQSCGVGDGDKRDCGYLGIDEGGCLAQGCCWQPVQRRGCGDS